MAKTAEEKAAAKAAKYAEKAAANAAAPSAPVDAGTPGPNPEAEATPEAEPAKGDVVVKYRDHKGDEASRTFSKEVHGKDFAKLAAEFKETNATRIIA